MSFTEFLEDFTQLKMSGAFTACLGRVATFDPVRMRADVLPLLALKNSAGVVSPLPVLPDVPVCIQGGGAGYAVKIPYVAGDLVVLLFPTHDIHAALLGVARPASGKINGLENAIMIGGVLGESNAPNPILEETGMILSAPQGAAYIKISPEGLTLHGATILVSGGTAFNLGTHTHMEMGDGAPTGPPL